MFGIDHDNVGLRLDKTTGRDRFAFSRIPHECYPVPATGYGESFENQSILTCLLPRSLWTLQVSVNKFKDAGLPGFTRKSSL